MSRLRYPVKAYLRDIADEAVVHRMGLAIEERLQRRRYRRSRPLLLVGAAVAAGLLVAVLPRLQRGAGPLRSADGHALAEMDGGKNGSELSLSDGSRVWLSPGGSLQPVHNTGERFSAIVGKGRADFDVRPGGPRLWTVECGLATVEVVGTSFACERESERLQVVVHHGVVLVRSDRLPQRVRRLTAGEHLEIRDSVEQPRLLAAEAQAPAERPVPTAAAGESPTDEGAQPRAAKASVAKNWRTLARSGHHDEAFVALGSEGLRRESRRLGVDDLLALADVARLSGHPAEAVMPLERILNEFSSDAQAPLAAFALGRLELDSLGRARASVASFRKALELGIPRALREDVMARLVEACVRDGDARSAQRAAAAYHDEFPNGRHAPSIARWLQTR